MSVMSTESCVNWCKPSRQYSFSKKAEVIIIKTLILCNGPEVRINGILKQLLPVAGKPILRRTVDLLRDRGQNDITIVTGNPKLMFDDVPSYDPGPDEPGTAVGLSSSELWSQKAPTLLLLGDVFYTEEAIDTILAPTDEDWQFYCRFGYNQDGSLGGGEGWAVKFKPKVGPKYRGVLISLSRRKLPDCHFWQHYRAMNGADPLVHVDFGYRIIIDDLTEDFDTRESYQRWLKKYHATVT